MAGRLLLDRFWSRVNLDGPISDARPDLGPCWVHDAPITEQTRYAVFYLTSRTRIYAHRFAYELLVGQVPEDLELDHLCRNRSCVNPSHLEPVTHQENVRRGRNAQREKTHCPRNHPYDDTSQTGYGDRRCRTCHNQQERDRARLKRAEKKGEVISHRG